MNQHVDILDQREDSLKRPLLASLMLHGGLVVAMTGFGWWTAHNASQWGTPNAMGGAVGVEAVNKIPLQNRSSIPNLVANDSDSSVPQKVEKQEKKKAPVDDPDAIPLERKKKNKASEQTAQMRKYSPVPERPNQVYSTSGPAINSPMYGKAGVNGIGIGDSTQAGRGCGGYLELVRMRIQQRWDVQPISQGLRASASLNLVLQRNGNPRDVSVLQSSGSSEIDFAARRAISEAGPFPPFLPSCEGNEAKIEVRFQPKR